MENAKNIIGMVGWVDLSTDNAEEIRDFYQQVISYDVMPISMGNYDDYCMLSPTDGDAKLGICHHTGSNQNMPPVWMIYLIVADLENSLSTCVSKGGKVLVGPKQQGDSGKYAIIQDPSGAYAGLYQYL